MDIIHIVITYMLLQTYTDVMLTYNKELYTNRISNNTYEEEGHVV